jgi:hypothetical protein
MNRLLAILLHPFLWALFWLLVWAESIRRPNQPWWGDPRDYE